MTLSSDAPSTAPVVGVRLFDRPAAPSDRDAEPVALRLDRLRVWCDERELRIVEEHRADGPLDLLDVLGEAAKLCRDEGTPLVVWDVRRAVGDHVAVRRLLRAIGDAPLVEARRDNRLMVADHGLILPVPTPWPIRRWKLAAARSGGAA